MLAGIYKHDDEMDLGRTEDKAKKKFISRQMGRMVVEKEI